MKLYKITIFFIFYEHFGKVGISYINLIVIEEGFELNKDKTYIVSGNQKKILTLLPK